MSTISTHVLDTARGCPAAGVGVTLEQEGSAGWLEAGSGVTNEDGRVTALLRADERLTPGRWRLTFATGEYHERTGQQDTPFYPSVTVEFVVAADVSHHHVPLLLSPFGYTTYRGS
jgi:5-hydroxyisourate hydrolase